MRRKYQSFFKFLKKTLMSCCTNTVTFACQHDACEDFHTGIFAIQDGTHTIAITSPIPIQSKKTLSVGDEIIISSNLLNEAATHTIKLYDPANMLINDTCYKLTTTITLTPCNN